MPPTPKHLASRELLERTRRDVLVRLLEPYRLFFSARRIDLDALAATAQDDHAALRPVHDLLVAGDPLLPPPLASALPAIEAVACDAGHERLRVLDTGKALPQGRLGHETLAAMAYLDHPALFAQVKVAARPPTISAYTEYAARSNRPLPRDAARFAALGAALGALLAARGRSPFCEPIVTHLERETVIDFVFGRLPATHERLTESLVRAQVTDVITQRVRAFFHHATSTLGVQGHAFMREAIRRLTGQHLLDDPDHFRVEGLYSLAPLQRDLDEALAPGHGAESITLREIWLRRADGVVTMHRGDTDLRQSRARKEARTDDRARKPSSVCARTAPERSRHLAGALARRSSHFGGDGFVTGPVIGLGTQTKLSIRTDES